MPLIFRQPDIIHEYDRVYNCPFSTFDCSFLQAKQLQISLCTNREEAELLQERLSEANHKESVQQDRIHQLEDELGLAAEAACSPPLPPQPLQPWPRQQQPQPPPPPPQLPPPPPPPRPQPQQQHESGQVAQPGAEWELPRRTHDGGMGWQTVAKGRGVRRGWLEERQQGGGMGGPPIFPVTPLKPQPAPMLLRHMFPPSNELPPPAAEASAPHLLLPLHQTPAIFASGQHQNPLSGEAATAALLPPPPLHPPQRQPDTAAASALHQLLAIGGLEARYGPEKIGLDIERMGMQLSSASDRLAKAGPAEGRRCMESLRARLEASPVGLRDLDMDMDLAWLVSGKPSIELVRAMVKGRLLELLEDNVWQHCGALMTVDRGSGWGVGGWGGANGEGGSSVVEEITLLDSRVVLVCEAARLVAASDRCRQLLAIRGAGCQAQAAASVAAPNMEAELQAWLHQATDRVARDLVQGGDGVDREAPRLMQGEVLQPVQGQGEGVAKANPIHQVQGGGDPEVNVDPMLSQMLFNLVRSAFWLWVLVSAAHPLLELWVSRPGQLLSLQDPRAHEVIKEVRVQ